jgi:hypothetical protein
MGINQQYQHLCKRWLEKAKQYDEVINASSFSKERCEALIDKFFTLYVVYNALYNEVHAILKREKTIPADKRCTEEEKAVGNVILSVTAEKLLSKISEDPAACRSMTRIEEIMKEGINSRRNRYGDLRICYNSNCIYDEDEDRKLQSKFYQKDKPAKYVKGILKLIYHIRCNLFHGKKEINAIQEEILSPSVILLERIVNIVYDKLTREF